jgi:hypothetical protein
MEEIANVIIRPSRHTYKPTDLGAKSIHSQPLSSAQNMLLLYDVVVVEHNLVRSIVSLNNGSKPLLLLLL